MFVSFFPNPRMFFSSAIVWALFAVLVWFFLARDAGGLIGLPNPPADAPPIVGVSRFVSPPFLWFYLYFGGVVGLFAAVWRVLDPHPYFNWSVLGSALIIFVLYFMVEVSVTINDWYGTYFDLIQKALDPSTKGTVPASDLYVGLGQITSVLLVYIVVAVLNAFFTSHYVFRWRTAMNDHYVENWGALRGIEGAAQRVQEDTMRFARTFEDLGTSLVSAIMTLIAFLPILAGLSAKIPEVPILGSVPYSLVIVSLVWALFGTGLLAIAGIKLPGLEFRNQRVEAAYRKELVYGEDDAARAAHLVRAFRRGAPELLPPLFQLSLLQRGALFLPAGGSDAAVLRADPVDRRRCHHLRHLPAGAGILRRSPGRHAVSRQVVALHRRVHVDLQAPARLRGGPSRRGAARDRPQVPAGWKAGLR